jgi:hypothetical protein
LWRRPDSTKIHTERFAQVSEAIIDPHFHFFTGRGHDFLAGEFLAIIGERHNIRGAIHVEAKAAR